jgi:phosphocarrier protein
LTVEQTVKITNRTGLHARPASELVKKAGKYNSKIEILFEGKEVNAKSIMGVMSLGVTRDNKITLKADGDDSKDAIEDLVNFIEVEMPKEDE